MNGGGLIKDGKCKGEDRASSVSEEAEDPARAATMEFAPLSALIRIQTWHLRSP